jgi:hypothetical protein
MRRPLRPKEILTFLCPICGAKPGRKCQLGSGEPRNTSHQDRRWAVKDSEPEDEVWIRPHPDCDDSSGGDPGWKAWNFPTRLTINGSRYLKLASVALDVKKFD